MTGTSHYIALVDLVSNIIIVYYTGMLQFAVAYSINQHHTHTHARTHLYTHTHAHTQLPELIHLKQKGCLRWGLFLVLNIGFLISFVVLLLLAIYEDQLNNLVNVK